MIKTASMLMWVTVLGCARAGALPGPAAAGPEAERPPVSLERALATALTEGRRAIRAPGASQVVLQDDQRWASATGWAVKGERETTAEDVFRIGSITKTYVAAVLVSLHVEGRLSLDDPASRWVPEAPHGDRYTLRQVLAHQTGLHDFVTTPRFATRLGRKESMRDLLAYVGRKPLRFEPGTVCRYSNSNYLIAGLAIEAATGRPWGVEVRERLLAPLGLTHTWVPSVDGEPTDLVRGYAVGLDVTRWFEPSRASAGGEIVATADDVARFAQALFFGDLVAPEVLALMTADVPTSEGRPTGHGLGLKRTETPHGTLLGHSGSTVSFQSRFHVHPPSRTVVVSLANSFFAEADVLDDAAWAVLAHRGVLNPPPPVEADRIVLGASRITPLSDGSPRRDAPHRRPAGEP